MNMREYIESGILELYVFGLLTEAENNEVKEMADKHEEVQEEILSIEKAVINLSYSIAPHLSAENYQKIRNILIEKHGGVVPLKPRKRSIAPYIGWAAAAVLLLGIGIQYTQYNKVQDEVQVVSAERAKFQSMLADLQVKKTEDEKALAIVRDKYSTVIQLAGQQVSPDSYAKVYVNSNKKEIYVDMAGLPEPPEGKVYQIWALKLDPLTPTSIGVIDNKNANNGILQVQNYDEAQAFGITLEPAGGSPTPTLEQLYTLGKV